VRFAAPTDRLGNWAAPSNTPTLPHIKPLGNAPAVKRLCPEGECVTCSKKETYALVGRLDRRVSRSGGGVHPQVTGGDSWKFQGLWSRLPIYGAC